MRRNASTFAPSDATGMEPTGAGPPAGFLPLAATCVNSRRCWWKLELKLPGIDTSQLALSWEGLAACEARAECDVEEEAHP